LDKFKKYPNLYSEISFGLTSTSILRMSTVQADLFANLLDSDPQIMSNKSLLRAMLTSSKFEISQSATNYVIEHNLFEDFWLLMLESNLPHVQKAAFEYLVAEQQKGEIVNKLLMALDSNNPLTRKYAIKVLHSIKSSTELRQVVESLVESRNIDTWAVVANNLDLISDLAKYRDFTKQVFLSRRKGRNVKEDIKLRIDAVISDITQAVEVDTLLRLAHSSVSKDRDWALKQIALSDLSLENVQIETTWKG